MATGKTKPNDDIDSAPTNEITLCSCGIAAAKPPKKNNCWFRVAYFHIKYQCPSSPTILYAQLITSVTIEFYYEYYIQARSLFSSI